MLEEDYENEPLPAARRAPASDLNEMAVAIASAISMWALATLVAFAAGYHGSGPTDRVNLLTISAGLLGFVIRRWQLKPRQWRLNRRRFPS
ncbi:hypothetical protein SB18R_08670 [Pseudomonas oryzihabitans]|nr:hypothetical protein BJP27_23445 [Pseudomonas psychrotolerans]KTT04592.1 hypothetical protein NS376_03920 [Pseudomonas psychrotolerans]KTT22066.1 hypothetical protein SB14R_18635 [Pseudomonas psychrotolerans]KTT32678.1 hypothetical protein SB9_14825 [Pseudomonas psychrotolerans]KTT53099.1 hypothetical protein SB11R_00110 [Pseudomonas psychrotolerans]